MSASNTATLWKVTIEEGRFASLREGEWLFTNERAAKAFVKAAEKLIPQMYCDISVEEIEAYKYASSAFWDARWPFAELDPARNQPAFVGEFNE